MLAQIFILSPARLHHSGCTGVTVSLDGTAATSSLTTIFGLAGWIATAVLWFSDP